MTEEENTPTVDIEEIKKLAQKNSTTEGKQSGKQGVMGTLVKKITNIPEVGDLVEGPVIGIEKSAVYVDLGPFGTGVIYGREYIAARDVIKKTNIGDVIAAKVIERENEDGYVELSLQEARKAIVWTEAEEAIKNKTPIEVTPKEANKGGLIIEWQGRALSTR